MFEDHPVICVTPAGRKRYLAILQHYVKKDFGLIDEWHLWLNTNKGEDAAYIEQLASEDSRIRILTTDSQRPFNSGRIGSFLVHAVTRNTIYVRFDDDVVWVEQGAVEKLIKYKLEHPELFLAGGNIVNNPVCNYRHANVGAFIPSAGITDAYNDHVGLTWLGDHIHRAFLAQSDKNKYYFPSEVLPLGKRFGIQFICWMGDDMAAFDGTVPHLDEEEFLTHERPLQCGKTLGLCGDALAVHFAYTEQRIGGSDWGGIDHPDLLKPYASLTV